MPTAILRCSALILTTSLLAEDMRPAYERAVKHLPAQASKLILNATIDPVWVRGQDKFVYRKQLPGETKEFILVDAAANTATPAFDHARLASALTDKGKEPVKASALPFDRVTLSGAGIEFAWKQKTWSCAIPAYECSIKNVPGPGEAASPDGNWIVFHRGDNLWIRSKSGQERPLTTDGQPYFGYGTTAEGINTITDRRQNRRRPPEVAWSPDSRRFVTYRLDERNVEQMHLIQAVPEGLWPAGGPRRPVLHSYRYALPGDANVPLMSLIAFDTETGSARRLRTPPLVQFQSVRQSPAASIFQGRRVIWSPDNRMLSIREIARDQRTLRLWSADSTTGEAQLLIEEKSATYLESPVPVTLLPKRKQFVWWSERSGWGHLYLYSEKGELIRPLTSGDWLVRSVLGADEDRGRLLLSASGRDPSLDPYWQRPYSVDLETAAITALANENCDHAILSSTPGRALSPTGRFFVERCSTVARAPVITIRNAGGKVIREVERTDAQAYAALGSPPVRTFKAKARDGKTDIHGTIHLPSNFNAARKYPVIDSDYPGPQITKAPKDFQPGSSEQALAELGFAVVQIDGLGKPFRSKAFREYAYGNMGDTGGLEDHIGQS